MSISQSTRITENIGSEGATWQSAIFEACRTNDLNGLQETFRACGITESDPVRWESDEKAGKPATCDMINAAVASKSATVLEFLFKVYPSAIPQSAYPGWPRSTAEAIFYNPDIEIFKVVHALGPHIMDYGANEEGGHSALFLALQPADTTLAMYLLDQGADPNFGWIHMSPLYLALVRSKPLQVIEKLLDCGAHYSANAIKSAVERERLDVLELFYERGWFDWMYQHDQDVFESVLQAAERIGNASIIAYVNHCFDRYHSRQAVGTGGSYTRSFGKFLDWLERPFRS